MEIFFKSNKLKKQLTESKEMVKAFGQMAKKVKQRMEELKASDDLSTMKLLPAAKCHELTGDKKGQLAVSISGNYRIIFEPEEEPPPTKNDGGLDWEKVLSIRILDVEDYHGK